MDGAEDFRLRLNVNPVGQPGRALVRSAPEGDAMSDRKRQRYRPKARNVLMPNFAANAAGLD
jgi:hypothetical protein